jgi:hypothetical protein
VRALHRDGPGAALRGRDAPELQPQLPGAMRHRRRAHLSGGRGGVRRLRHRGGDRGPPRAWRSPDGRRTGCLRGGRRDDRPAGRGPRRSGGGSRPQHRPDPDARAARRHDPRCGAPGNRRQHHDRRHHARGRRDTAPALQHPRHLAVRLLSHGPRVRGAGAAGEGRLHRGRRQLRPGLQPGARGPRADGAGHSRGSCAVLRAHPPREPRQLRHPAGKPLSVSNLTNGEPFEVGYDLTPRQARILLAGGLLNYIREGGR